MACQSCAERRAAMKVWLGKQAENARKWAAVRMGDAPKPADVQAEQAPDSDAQAQGSGQAADQGAEHQQRRVEADQAARTAEGRASVPSVRKARGGKGSAR